jgi:hypothetical protein
VTTSVFLGICKNCAEKYIKFIQTIAKKVNNIQYKIMKNLFSQIKRRVLKVMCLCFYSIISVAYSANFNVSMSGNDENSGGSDSPWRTIGKANSVVKAGDVISIGPGVWEEKITIASGGTAENPIIWSGSGKLKTQCVQFIVNKPFVHIKNMTMSRNIETNAANVLIEEIKFTWNGGRQFWVHPTGGYSGPDGVMARKCDFIDCGYAAAVSLNGVNGLIEDSYFTTANGGDAIYLNGRNNIVRNCFFENWNRPAGSDQHTDLFQSFSNNGEISQDHIIEGNFALNCKGCQIGNIDNVGSPARIKNWTWRNNIFVNVSNPLNLYSPGHKFYNNTFFRSPSGAGSCVLLRAASKGVAEDCEFYNNIFYKGGSNVSSDAQGFYGFAFSTGYAIKNFTADYNLVIGEGNGTVKKGMWRSFESNNNSLNGIDPLFAQSIDPSSADHLRITDTSPARGAGKNLSSLFTVDFLGLPRGERWDIGAMQFGVKNSIRSLSSPTGFRVKAE